MNAQVGITTLFYQWISYKYNQVYEEKKILKNFFQQT